MRGKSIERESLIKKIHSPLTLINLPLGLQLWQVWKKKRQPYISPHTPSFLRIKSQIKIHMYQQCICLQQVEGKKVKKGKKRNSLVGSYRTGWHFSSVDDQEPESDQ